METIYKYALQHGADTELQMDKQAVVRRVSMQRGTLCIWVQLDSRAILASRWFRIIGTGHAVPERGEYVGSCDDGLFVWHVFEIVGDAR